MARKNEGQDALLKFNRVSPPANVLFSLLFIVLALVCVIPFIFVIIISISSDQSIQTNGYTFFPSAWSGGAYAYLWKLNGLIGQSFIISIVVTVALISECLSIIIGALDFERSGHARHPADRSRAISAVSASTSASDR